jgi:SNARE protein
MADVQYWDDTLTEECQSIRQLLNNASSALESAGGKATALDKAEKKLRAAQGTAKSYKMETRLVPDPKQRRNYETKLSQLSDELATLANDIKALRSHMHRDQLFVGAKSTGATSTDGMTGEEAGDIMLQDMNVIQDKTKSSLANTKGMVAASKQVGEATMEELLRQREQIRTIDNEAMRIEDNLNRADKLIKTFGKRMATDRFIQCFACVNILLLAGVVGYFVFKNQTKQPNQNNNTSNVPANPVGNNRLLVGLRGGSPDWWE